MSESAKKPSRKQQILEALASQLETSPGQRITTAGLAKAVGVSEAALYRHFPSKARMFEGLIDFIEETVFGLINRILEEEIQAHIRCEQILTVLLGFANNNPGITRILVGDVLTGESDRLRQRVGQFYDRIETQIKQILREGEANGEIPPVSPVSALSNMMVACAEGRMNQFVRSGFQRSPLEHWEKQWPRLRAGIFQSK